MLKSFLSSLDILSHRQKMIQLADASELGWRVVHEYEQNLLADDSDDEKKMNKAEVRTDRKFKAEKNKKSKKFRTKPYTRLYLHELQVNPLRSNLLYRNQAYVFIVESRVTGEKNAQQILQI
jgi:hypothetical protein